MHIITYASHIKLQQCNGSKVNQNDDFQQHREANTVNNYVSYDMRNFPSLGMMTTIELHSLNSISAPTLVSIEQNFLEPEDPSRINLSGPGARSLHTTGTVTTKVHTSSQYICDLQLWHQRCPRFGL